MQLFQVAFAKLTSLSLGDWCLHDSCKALLYLLEHSPSLEETYFERCVNRVRTCSILMGHAMATWGGWGLVCKKYHQFQGFSTKHWTATLLIEGFSIKYDRIFSKTVVTISPKKIL
jgi:hypothetical protein